jgi:hypothetical protein
MSGTWLGGGESKPHLELRGKEVIVERINCYDGSIPVAYLRETIHHFNDEESAREYYYKKKYCKK